MSEKLGPETRSEEETPRLGTDESSDAPAFPDPPPSKPATATRSMSPSHGAVALTNAPPPANDKVKTIIASLAVVIGLAGTAYAITNRASRPETTPTASEAPRAREAKPAEPMQDAPTPFVSAASALTSAQKPEAAKRPAAALSAPKPPVLRPGPWPPAPKASAAPSARPNGQKPDGQKPDALDIGY